MCSPISGGGVRMREGVRLMMIGCPTSSTSPRSCERTRLSEPEVAHLRVGEHLIDGVDRAAGHPGLVQQLDPVRARGAAQDRRQLGIQRIAVVRAVGGLRVGGIAGQLLVSDRLQKRRQIS